MFKPAAGSCRWALVIRPHHPSGAFDARHRQGHRQGHSERLTAPRGWEVVRLAPDPDSLLLSTDDLLALADAVRESGRPVPPPPEVTPSGPDVGRRGHLRVLRPVEG